MQLLPGAVSSAKEIASLPDTILNEALQPLHVVFDSVSCLGNFPVSASMCICVSGLDAAH